MGQEVGGSAPCLVGARSRATSRMSVSGLLAAGRAREDHDQPDEGAVHVEAHRPAGPVDLQGVVIMAELLSTSTNGRSGAGPEVVRGR